ncbi:MAG: ABC transporter permease [Acidobacteria bacterium]|nr:ABC transporter permease [Acidobacteriota bacterium]
MFYALRKLTRQIQYWLHRGQRERELREEMEEHRRMRGAGSIARTSAHMEDARAVWIPPALESLVQDVRYGARQLIQHRLFTCVCLSGLALGIGLNSAVFSVIEAVYWRPFPVKEGDRVVRIYRIDVNDRTGSPFSEDELRHYQESGSLEAVTGYSMETTLAEWPRGAALSALTAFVAPNFFDMIGAEVVKGRMPDEEDTAIWITETAWKRRMQSDPDVIGSKLLLNNVPFTIAGVISNRSFSVANSATEIILPLRTAPRLRLAIAASHLRLLGRVPHGSTIDAAHTSLDVVAQRWFAEHVQDKRIYRPLAVRARLAEGTQGETAGPAVLIPVASILVLIIACANLTNLLLARAEARRAEMAVRLSLGASRFRLVRQLLTECFLLTSMAGVLGLAAANGMLRIAAAMLPKYLPDDASLPWVDVGVNQVVFLFTLALCAATAILFGLVPALEATRTEVSGSLKTQSRGVAGAAPGARLRSALIAIQMAACVTLLVLTASLHGSMSVIDDFLNAFNAKPVIQVRIFMPGVTPEASAQAIDRVRGQLRELPSVQATAITVFPFLRTLGRGSGAELEIEGHTGVRMPAPGMDGYLSDGGLDVFGMRLTYGREFTAAESRLGAPVVLINEPMARDWWPNESPVGRRIRIWRKGEAGPWQEIAGVIAEKTIGEGGAGSHSMLYPLGNSRMPGTIQLKVSGDRQAAISAIRTAIRDRNADIVPSVNSLETAVEFTRWAPRLASAGSLSIAIASLWMAAVGLYGVTAYLASRRTKEIGIRMALGATASVVVRMMVRQGAILVTTGLIIGMFVAIAAERVLASTLRLLPARSAVTYLAVLGFLGAVAFLAILAPSIRATRVAPLDALRYDG